MLNNKRKRKIVNDINKYNDFIKHLDQTNIFKESEPTPSPLNLSNILKDDTINEAINENIISEKNIIDNIINQIENNFKDNNFDNSNFNGIRQYDVFLNNISTHDPNAYEEPNFGCNTFTESKIRTLLTDFKQKFEKANDESHRTFERKMITIQTEINNINDIIELTNKYYLDPCIEYNINMKALHKIKEPLIELNAMIGMNDLKNNIVDQILYFIQDLHKGKTNTGDFMHTVIYGPPGTGKTEIAKIMGKIYSKIGMLNKGTFKKVTRSDLIAGYLGQTAIKTKDVIKDSLGGVLFIDEAYALGNNEKRDSFSKECIDTLCEALSDHKENLMVIIAGYEDELKECFFDYNQGLDSRFTWRFKTEQYKAEELYKIFIKKVKDIGWSIDEKNIINPEFFKIKYDYFKSYGRDIETLLAKTKIAHSKRVFCLPESEKRKISMKDLEKGFEIYINNDNVKSRHEKEKLKKEIYSSIYC
jgi:SpoVK/Ycf46/Vps4 family AAA+-type ATPase